MGLIIEGDRYVILSDILGDEDHLGDMDFKVAGTRDGITSIQMDIKVKGITREIMKEALAQAREGRLHILQKMYEAIPEPRRELSPYAPRIVIHRIPEEKAPLIIGPGGANVKKIYEETEVKVWVGPYGAFVEILPGKIGLLHVSKMAHPVKHAGERYSVGDVVKVKVLEVDEMGRPKFTTMGIDGEKRLQERIEVGRVRVRDARDIFEVGQEDPSLRIG